MSTPTPILPSAVAPAPAAALDKLAGPPTVLDKILAEAKPYLDKAQETVKPYTDKALETAKPYTDKAIETTKPYTDAVAAKTMEIVHSIEGTASHASAKTGQATSNLEAGLAETTDKAVVEGKSDAQGLGGYLSSGLAAATSTFNQVTSSIEKSTTTATHPGLITQLEQVGAKIVAKADAVFGEPAKTEVPVVVVPVVATTTNPVPHSA